MTIPTPNRDMQHGGMEAVGAIEQSIKDVMRSGRNILASGGVWNAADAAADAAAEIRRQRDSLLKIIQESPVVS